MKTLVVYYSLEGNTQYLAESLSECIGIDVIRLKPVKDIKDNVLKYLIGGRQAIQKKMLELEPINLIPQEYDLIIIGTPVWASTLVPAIRTFLSNVSLSGKKIGLFCCYGRSEGKALKQMEEMLEGNIILAKIGFKEPIKGEESQKNAFCEWAKYLIEEVKGSA